MKKLHKLGKGILDLPNVQCASVWSPDRITQIAEVAFFHVLGELDEMALRKESGPGARKRLREDKKMVESQRAVMRRPNKHPRPEVLGARPKN